MNYIISPSNDAYFNMALEEYLLTNIADTQDYFMLWQNKGAVVVGRYQNTIEEINQLFVKENNIQLVRRLSGGGAMFQDLGNINFTFIANHVKAKQIDFNLFTSPVIEALKTFGINATAGDRNDILINGLKISGNSQFRRNGRVLHHGTMLFNSNLDNVSSALNVNADKFSSKSVKSVRSRVTNIIEHNSKMDISQFKETLISHICGNNATEYKLTEKDYTCIQKLSADKYSSWEWNYGQSPKCNITRYKRFGFGGVSAHISVNEGIIAQISFSGDFFGSENLNELENTISGCRLDERSIIQKLEDIDSSIYIFGMDNETLASFIVN